MDDNVVVFAIVNERFFNYNNIFYHMNEKTYMTYGELCCFNYTINPSMYPSMGLLCNYPWIFHDIIFNSY
jgi:hypothetical protein